MVAADGRAAEIAPAGRQGERAPLHTPDLDMQGWGAKVDAEAHRHRKASALANMLLQQAPPSLQPRGVGTP
jgi:hypothetical protein